MFPFENPNIQDQIDQINRQLNQGDRQSNELSRLSDWNSQIPVPSFSTSLTSSSIFNSSMSAPTFAGNTTIFSGSYTATQEATQSYALTGVLLGATALYIQAELTISSGGNQQLQVQDASGNWYAVTAIISTGQTNLLTMWVPVVGGALLWRINAVGSIGGTLVFRAIGF